MHKRHQQINIPTEIVRTLVAIAETGSFSKAADRMNLSQPAVSAQVKRLQNLVGGAVFFKPASGGIDFTPRGRLVLAHARRLLEGNDQILSLGGGAPDHQPIRLGIASIYGGVLLGLRKHPEAWRMFSFHCDRSDKISQALNEGYIDVGCFIDHSSQFDDLAVSWEEDFVWARRPDFVLSPGTPIPLVSWPGKPADLPALNALERAGIAYRIVFASSDVHARCLAVAAGIGLMAMPRRFVAAPLVVANDYYLPKLRPVRAGVSVRRGFVADGLNDAIAVLAKLAPNIAEPVTADKCDGAATPVNTITFDARSNRALI